MNQPYLEPDFLQAVGEMTISFTLLDATLSNVFNAIEGNKDMAGIASMPFGRKVDGFIELLRAC